MAHSKPHRASQKLLMRILDIKRLITANQITGRQLRGTTRRLSAGIIAMEREIKALRVDQLPRSNFQMKSCLKKPPPTSLQMTAIHGLETQMKTVVYPPFLPPCYGMNSVSPCPGCGLELPVAIRASKRSQVLIRSIAFITHCLTECSEYLSLGLHANCDICQLSFVTKKSFRRHFAKLHAIRKPSWMVQTIFKNSRCGVMSETKFSSCPGCHTKFAKISANGKDKLTFDYHVHCIEECEKYKELNLIAECYECKVKFLSPRCVQRHISIHHQNAENYSREWMTNNVLNNSSMGQTYDTTVNCPGCDKDFPAKQKRNQLRYRRDYLVHCIEECGAYKELGLIAQCEICDCKFLSNNNLKVHKTYCKQTRRV